jgi:N-methylhydantoinase B
MVFRPHGIEAMYGTMFGMRRWLPIQGFAGGRPGATTQFLIHRANGAVEALDVISSGARVGAEDWFEMWVGSGGGYGDPLDRDPAKVELDVRQGRFDAMLAREAYGVIVGDPTATERLRDDLRKARLARARPAAKPLSRQAVKIAGAPQPLFPGVVQYGDVAAAAISGAPLARAPDAWTEGCPVLVERLWGEDGPEVVYRSWLDPETGRALHVEAVLGDDPDRFHAAPKRWAEAAS